MPPTTRRAELTAQITALHEDQIESLRDATFTGWTPEEKAEQQKRSDRIAALTRELNGMT
jgi:hypothetical protein